MDIRLSKFWCNAECLAWKARVRDTDAGTHENAFFVVKNLGRSIPTIEISSEKPEGLNFNNPLAQQVRSRFPHGYLGSHYRTSDGSVWLKLVGRQTLYLGLLRMDGFTVALIDESGCSLVRRSSRGTFTKKKPLPMPLPTDDDIIKIPLSPTTTVKDSSSPPKRSSTKSPAQKVLQKRLARRRRTLRASLRRQEAIIPPQDEIEEQESQAKMLQQFSYLGTDFTEKLELNPESTTLPHTSVIDLDPQRTLGENINEAFRQLKRLQRRRSLGMARAAELRQQIEDVEAAQEKVANDILSPEESQAIIQENRLKLNPASPRPRLSRSVAKKPWKTYAVGDELVAHVGRTALESDDLLRWARTNDLWFHITSGTGGHVIIPVRKWAKQPEALEKARRIGAILAIHHSGFRDSMAGEVHLGTRQSIHKPKGSPPGKWLIRHAQSMYAKYDKQELQKVLGDSLF